MLFSHTSRPTATSYPINGCQAVSIGRYSYVAEHAHLLAYLTSPDLVIGDFCSIAANSRFFARQNHHTDWVSSFPIEFVLGAQSGVSRHDDLPSRIEIGHDVWIGDGATLLPGISVGHGAVIGANALVAKDVPPYAVFVGNPGRVARLRFDETVVNSLLALRWWNWPIERIHAMAQLIWSPNIKAFLAAALET